MTVAIPKRSWRTLFAAGALMAFLPARGAAQQHMLPPGDALARAIADGTTLDRANLRAGDQFVVPHRRSADETLRLLGIVITVPAAVYGLTRLF